MPLNIIRADITKVKADAIVNTANPMVAIGAGVDQAIYDAAGAEQLLAERAKIGPMKPGQAAATPAFGLDAKYIIHTIGPAWEGGKYGEYDAVASCYKESLKIADELHCESIAFPLISTGTLGFPKDKALNIAISEISSFLFEHDMKVYMVVYDKEAFVISGKAFAGVRTYIEERDVKPPAYSVNRRERRSRDLMYHRTEQSIGGHFPGAAKEDISLAEEALEVNKEVDGFIEDDEVFEMSAEPAAAFSTPHAIDFGDLPSDPGEIVPGESFQDVLFRHIDRQDLEDPEVYHRANLDRKLFSKIRGPKYKPSKKTALALAIALKLNLDETLDLIGRAGYALSEASLFDLIICYCIENKIYNIHEVNAILFKYTNDVLAV
ncbi:MAG: macro domain-containing protein [Clostridia bacterium]|nr:macro domain-containing protein [Clostridia bacterium]